MLDHLTGKVHSVSDDGVVLSLGGVGIRIEMPTRDLPKLAGDATVYTVLQIRDEEIHLYGFGSERTRELFTALTSVSKVGPKVAMAILSFHTPDALVRAIGTSDHGALSAVSGVGGKTAERIVLELRDKLGVIAEPVAAAPTNSSLGAVREGLKGLGYSTQEIQDALANLPPDGDVPTLMRHALRSLGNDKVSSNGSR